LEKELNAGEPERQQRALRRIAQGGNLVDDAKTEAKSAKDPNRVSIAALNISFHSIHKYFLLISPSYFRVLLSCQSIDSWVG
jgi:hypothetical protein